MNKTINYEDGKNMQESDKIWLIFDEFNKYNEDVAEKDLLRAAQDLIDLSKSEYVHKNEIDRKDRLSFQNCDLVDAFTKYEDRIFKSEYPKLKSELIEEKEAISIRRFKRLNKLGN
tara:strand:+ start:343 stop:690 length:348 start_codon:yes stop_codon:yes gene_type:complete